MVRVVGVVRVVRLVEVIRVVEVVYRYAQQRHFDEFSQSHSFFSCNTLSSKCHTLLVLYTAKKEVC